MPKIRRHWLKASGESKGDLQGNFVFAELWSGKEVEADMKAMFKRCLDKHLNIREWRDIDHVKADGINLN